MPTALVHAPSVRTVAPRKLSFGEKGRLAVEVLASYARARRGLVQENLPATLMRLRGDAPPDGAPDPQTWIEGARLSQVVVRVLRVLPVGTRCLTRSLVLTSLLARRGVGSRLVIGVKPGEEFGAHAWVELGGRPLLPTGGGEFARLVDL